MPELPEVETVRRGLQPVMEGVRVARLVQRRPDLRFPFPELFAERVEGRTVLRLGRRAKYLLADIEGGDTLVMHLGMSGRFTIAQPRATPSESNASSVASFRHGREGGHPRQIDMDVGADGSSQRRSKAETKHAKQAHMDGRLRGHDEKAGAAADRIVGVTAPHPDPLPAEGRREGTQEQPGDFVHEAGGIAAHDHVTFHMQNGAAVTYNDARRFGFMLLIPTAELAQHALFHDLGVEPLGDDLDAAHLAKQAQGRKTDLKAFLLDQRNIAGLGNIYVSEALHRARLSPRKRASVLATRTGAPTLHAERLVPEIKAVLLAALQAGGSTLRDYRQADGGTGNFQHRFEVYGREGDPCGHAGCSGTIKRIVQAGRSTFYCAKCQR